MILNVNTQYCDGINKLDISLSFIPVALASVENVVQHISWYNLSLLRNQHYQDCLRCYNKIFTNVNVWLNWISWAYYASPVFSKSIETRLLVIKNFNLLSWEFAFDRFAVKIYFLVQIPYPIYHFFTFSLVGNYTKTMIFSHFSIYLNDIQGFLNF